METGNRIRIAREHKRYTQQEFAKHIDVKEGIVRHWEAGVLFPTAYELYKIAKCLDLTIDEFLKDDTRMVNAIEYNHRLLKTTRIFITISALSIMITLFALLFSFGSRELQTNLIDLNIWISMFCMLANFVLISVYRVPQKENH
ncbi:MULTISPECIES: helix-turn-helix transcriptional regulator [unclassified Breznakia]|uniref:helix-turn-helix transcriptional regulator n=1 Tax=unclassified Breznakia TaxID=2623764 RepID=UPI002473FFF8|nr:MULTISPECIES: helix-turn-helix transcriptional regulator [unclassified Breznakia]MDH6367482.1 transcriptional regulator with XRE-family HTH domain [Breznakia sp. PH1-1]MDH6404602.1 transcriptional regulator with XRE-family HTH domain [Breznakia sp. PF1-11]MDH6412311.1 transcriptional regulator with XRE-family HTH domain [Breznakia sp. PFB1-11]MDH6414649.1 transcriptional regulator with XRE-family HTH domain [Breznakia sp. PFB1-14]MDH6416956.1 transcriptional regulator with XRE-family HTH do